jgi:hypothetical protein
MTLPLARGLRPGTYPMLKAERAKLCLKVQRREMMMESEGDRDKRQ